MKNPSLANVNLIIIDFEITSEINALDFEGKDKYFLSVSREKLQSELKKIGAKNTKIHDEIKLYSKDTSLLLCIGETIIQMSKKWREIETVSGLLNFQLPFHLKSVDHDFLSNIKDGFPNKRWKKYFKKGNFELRAGTKEDVYDFYMDVFKKFHLFNDLTNIDLIEIIRHFNLAL